MIRLLAAPAVVVVAVVVVMVAIVVVTAAASAIGWAKSAPSSGTPLGVHCRCSDCLLWRHRRC